MQPKSSPLHSQLPSLTSFPILGVNPDDFGHTVVDSLGD